MEFDGNPDTLKIAENLARNNSEAMSIYSHKIKASSYYKKIFDKVILKIK